MESVQGFCTFPWHLETELQRLFEVVYYQQSGIPTAHVYVLCLRLFPAIIVTIHNLLMILLNLLNNRARRHNLKLKRALWMTLQCNFFIIYYLQVPFVLFSMSDASCGGVSDHFVAAFNKLIDLFFFRTTDSLTIPWCYQCRPTQFIKLVFE